ncbi:MAG: flagellar assembly protein FliW, partial [Solirubrobacteraceae bacterium]
GYGRHCPDLTDELPSDMNATSLNIAAGHAHAGTPPGGAGSRPTEQVQTTRWGAVEIQLDTIITFPDGLIGLGGRRYALISTDPGSPFQWLQSLDHPAVALPVTNPHRFFKDFAVELEPAEIEQLGLENGEGADVLVTVTVSADASATTVNLKAPILIRAGLGYQVMNRRPGMLVKTPLLASAAAGGAARAA